MNCNLQRGLEDRWIEDPQMSFNGGKGTAKFEIQFRGLFSRPINGICLTIVEEKRGLNSQDSRVTTSSIAV